MKLACLWRPDVWGVRNLSTEYLNVTHWILFMIMNCTLLSPLHNTCSAHEISLPMEAGFVRCQKFEYWISKIQLWHSLRSTATPHVTRNVGQNTRPSFCFLWGSVNETKSGCYYNIMVNKRATIIVGLRTRVASPTNIEFTPPSPNLTGGAKSNGHNFMEFFNYF